MSGIAGFTNYQHIYKDNDNVLRDMLRAIKHRGPDSKSEYNDSTVHMGVRHNDYGRNDVSHIIKAANYIVAFDGVLYNEESLWNALSTDELICSDKTTESLIANLYVQLGEAFVNHLNGMFALIIYNTDNGMLIGARDRFGSKPLYYTCIDGNLIYSSEIKSILKYPEYKASVNETALREYLQKGYHTQTETMFSNIFAVPAAHYFTYKHSKLSICRYWKATFSPDNNKEIIASASEINTYLSDAVDNTVAGNCTTLLSANLADNYVTALSDTDAGFSVIFDFDKRSEINYVDNLCNSLKIDNSSVHVTTAQCIDALSDIIYYMDEPTTNDAMLSVYFACKNTSAHSTPMLAGVGGNTFLTCPQPETEFKMLEHELAVYDKLSMANSIEIRMPYLNNNFFEVASTLPCEFKTDRKTRTGKTLSKNILFHASTKCLPAQLTYTNSESRQIPVAVWLRNEKYYKTVKEALSSDTSAQYLNQAQLLKALENHKQYKADNSKIIMRAYLFILWHNRFFD